MFAGKNVVSDRGDYRSNKEDGMFKPIMWRMPRRIIRDSDDWFSHPWENKYYSCC